MTNRVLRFFEEAWGDEQLRIMVCLSLSLPPCRPSIQTPNSKPIFFLKFINLRVNIEYRPDFSHLVGLLGDCRHNKKNI